MQKNEMTESRWSHGHCYPMAVAISEVIACPIRVLWSKKRPSDLSWHPVHMLAEPSPGLLLDVTGYRYPDEVFDDYLPEEDLARPHARSIGRWETFENKAKLYQALISNAGDDFEFIRRYGIPFIEELIPEAKIVFETYVRPMIKMHKPEDSSDLSPAP